MAGDNHFFHVLLPLDQVGVAFLNGLHPRAHLVVFINEREVQLVQRINGRHVAFHDGTQGFGFFFDFAELPISIFDAGHEPVNLTALIGDFRQHERVFGGEGVVAETQFFEVKKDLVALEGEGRVVPFDGFDGFAFLVQLKPEKQAYKRQNSGYSNQDAL